MSSDLRRAAWFACSGRGRIIKDDAAKQWLRGANEGIHKSRNQPRKDKPFDVGALRMRFGMPSFLGLNHPVDALNT